jgi:hypothetical protein
MSILIEPGLPDGIFSNQNNNLGKFWRALKWKRLVFERPIGIYMLLPFGLYYSHLVILWQFWYIFPVLVCCVKKTLATLNVTF